MYNTSMTTTPDEAPQQTDTPAPSPAESTPVPPQIAADTAARVDAVTTPKKYPPTPQGLKERREAGEISPFDVDKIELFNYSQGDVPLQRKDLQSATGEQAVVLTREDMNFLVDLYYIDKKGRRIELHLDEFPGDVFILFPDDLGNL